jgi:hypothetical protein
MWFCVQICYFYLLVTALLHFHTPDMGNCWARVELGGGVSLNLVGDDHKNKQYVMRYEMPRLTIILKTAVFPSG